MFLFVFLGLFILDVIFYFWRALAGLIIFNWFAPIIWPEITASYMQVLSALLLLGAYRSLTIQSKTLTKDEIHQRIAWNIVIPPITVVIFGLLYLCCVVPFK